MRGLKEDVVIEFSTPEPWAQPNEFNTSGGLEGQRGHVPLEVYQKELHSRGQSTNVSPHSRALIIAETVNTRFKHYHEFSK